MVIFNSYVKLPEGTATIKVLKQYKVAEAAAQGGQLPLWSEGIVDNIAEELARCATEFCGA